MDTDNALCNRMTKPEFDALCKTNPNLIVTDEEAYNLAFRHVRGCYQAALLLGREPLSGAGLAGNARSYGYHYAQSRANLLARLTKAGIPWGEAQGIRGKRILVIGQVPA